MACPYVYDTFMTLCLYERLMEHNQGTYYIDRDLSAVTLQIPASKGKPYSDKILYLFGDVNDNANVTSIETFFKSFVQDEQICIFNKFIHETKDQRSVRSSAVLVTNYSRIMSFDSYCDVWYVKKIISDLSFWLSPEFIVELQMYAETAPIAAKIIHMEKNIQNITRQYKSRLFCEGLPRDLANLCMSYESCF